MFNLVLAQVQRVFLFNGKKSGCSNIDFESSKVFFQFYVFNSLLVADTCKLDHSEAVFLVVCDHSMNEL